MLMWSHFPNCLAWIIFCYISKSFFLQLEFVFHPHIDLYLLVNNAYLAALLLKLEKRIAEVTIESKELGFSKPGPYIYELLADLNITQETASKLIEIIEEATELLEEDNQRKAKGTVCRLESISDILNIIFRDKDNAHAKSYYVSLKC